MENAIKYYYNLDVLNLRKSKLNYLFEYNKFNYILFHTEYEDDYIKELHKLSLTLLNNNILVHVMIFNINNTLTTIIEGKKYILMQIINNKKKIDIEDIYNFNIKLDYNKCNWFSLWTQKIDYYEYQIQEFINKYPIIKESFNYFIGLTEIGIFLLSENDNKFDLVASHKRVSTYSIDFYNPLNLTIDLKVRDMAEYIKLMFYNQMDIDKLMTIIYEYISKINNNERYMFFVRMFYPTLYFDLYEDIIIDEKDEHKLISVINKIDNYENLLNYIHNQISFYIRLIDIDFIKKE